MIFLNPNLIIWYFCSFMSILAIEMLNTHNLLFLGRPNIILVPSTSSHLYNLTKIYYPRIRFNKYLIYLFKIFLAMLFCTRNTLIFLVMFLIWISLEVSLKSWNLNEFNQRPEFVAGNTYITRWSELENAISFITVLLIYKASKGNQFY